MLKFAANLSMLFTEAPFLDRFDVAARAGFSAVEFLFPYDYEASQIAARLQRNALELVLFNLPPGDWNGGERGISIFPDRRDEFRAGVATAVDYAKSLGCKKLHCLAGVAPSEGDSAQMLETYVDNLRYAAGALRAIGATLLIEPINTRDIPNYYLTSCQQARDVIERVGAPNLRLQFDAYHTHMMGGSAADLAAANFDIIQHVQIADAPGRREPGTGVINFASLFRRLEALGYEGWIGCEYRPSSSTVESLSWLRERREFQPT